MTTAGEVPPGDAAGGKFLLQTPDASSVARPSWVRGAIGDAYGLLFGVMPILALAKGNQGGYALADLSELVGLMLAIFGLIFVAARAVWRRSPEMAGLTTTVFAFWTWCYLPLQSVARARLGAPASHRLFVPICAAASILALRLIHAHPRVRSWLASIARSTAVLVTVWLVFSLARQWVQNARNVSGSAFLHTLSAPIPLRPAGREATRGEAAASRELPDIYVIILDEYAGEHALREILDFDNRPFVDSLRAMGFVVPQRVVPNYVQTALSLPSFLNMTLLSPLAREVGTDSRNHVLLYHLIEHNRAMRLAKAAGYRVVGIPPAWWPGSARLADAEVISAPIPIWRGRDWVSASELRQELWNESIIRVTGASAGEAIPEWTLRSMRELKRLADDPAPTFAFAHLLLPHVPYYLDSNCKVIIRKDLFYGSRARRTGYPNQLRCANKLLLDFTHDVIERSSPPPVIVLQGDHGSRSIDRGRLRDENPTAAQLRERFDAFGAYYLPGDSAATLKGSVSLVNVMRYVFSRYVGADLPPIADTAFYSTETRPFRFRPVDTAAFFRR